MPSRLQNRMQSYQHQLYDLYTDSLDNDFLSCDSNVEFIIARNNSQRPFDTDNLSNSISTPRWSHHSVVFRQNLLRPTTLLPNSLAQRSISSFTDFSPKSPTTLLRNPLAKQPISSFASFNSSNSIRCRFYISLVFHQKHRPLRSRTQWPGSLTAQSNSQANFSQLVHNVVAMRLSHVQVKCVYN